VFSPLLGIIAASPPLCRFSVSLILSLSLNKSIECVAQDARYGILSHNFLNVVFARSETSCYSEFLILFFTGIFMITQICISSGAAVTAVFVMHIHGKWTNGDTVPGWILAITFFQ
jgi:hypothetical protein